MIKRWHWFLLVIVGCSLAWLSYAKAQSDDKDKSKSKAKDETELTLENLYPEKSMFGPSARSPQFSQDGRYVAYLYRTYPKRRHGNNLYLYDFQTGKTVQLTNVSVMSEFQRSARGVKDDRLEKHRKEQQKKKKEGEDESDGDDKAKEQDKDKDSGKTSQEGDKEKRQKTKQEIEEEQKIILSVNDKDADDEKAPRYSGISSFKWHPQDNSILISSEGDLYLIKDVTKPELVRLTKTTASESQAEFLPDGSGFIFSSGDVIHRITEGSHMVEQINPRLSGGQRMSQFALSPDGKRLVMVTRTGDRSSAGGRRVDIIRYRDRFAKSDSISRTVSDDEIKPYDVQVYLFDLDAADTEESKLVRIFKTQIDEPRDVISSPKWSLDSQQVTFCFFDQNNSEVQIRLAKFPSEEDIKKAGKTAKKTEPQPEEESTETRGRRRPGGGPSSRGPEAVDIESRVVYRFKHYGGPNTPRMVSPDFAGDNKHIVFVSEQSGFRHIHLLDPLYESMRQLTNGHFEVYPIRFSDDHQHMFVTATKDSPARQMVYSLNLESGELDQISKEVGNYSSAAVSNDGKRFAANFVKYGQLTEFMVQDGGGKNEMLTDSHPEKVKKLTEIKPEFFEYENRHGHTIAGMMFKPKDWKKSDKHPLLIYVYGGPLGTRHSVNDGSYSADGYFFQMYMAQKHGYFTIVVDPRGQSGYGGFFEKSNFEQVGKPQVEDLVDSVKYMAENYNIDEERVALYGWSFGGFQTQMCMYTEPDVFQVGIAGAGPTEWENYNSWYTTGTVGPSRKGTPDQKKYSLVPLAKNLKGKLLLVHGMEDTNVLFQDTVAVYRALLKAGKETNVDLFLDPTGGHGLGGDVKRLGRMRKYEEYLLRTIGSVE